LDIAVENKCDLQQATPAPQRRSAMIVLPPAVEDNNLYVRQSILAPPPQPQVQRPREPSATTSDAEGSLGVETGEASGYETVDIHEDYGIGKRKKHAQGTRTWDIHQLIKDNMSTGQDLIECVRLPEGFARDEWIAVHVVDFFNEINLLYGTISEFCTAETCPRMSAGPCYAYAWTDVTSLAQPQASGSATHLPASQYVARLMDWIERQINDPRVFPSNAAHYQSGFEHETARVILKRLFRVYAHMYHSHLDHFVELSADVHLGFCFKRFVFFVKQFDLVDDKELHALRKFVQSVLENPVNVLVGADTPET
jgi:MOB kinase activator 1